MEKNNEPDSLRTMLAGLDMYLKEKGCKFSILRDRELIHVVNIEWQGYRAS